MQHRFKVTHAGIPAFLVLTGIITSILLGYNAHLLPVHAVSRGRSLPATSFSNVMSAFYPNPNDSGTFDVTPTTSPVFTQSFPTLDFNPPTSLQSCSNSTGIDEYSRPFTNLSQQADGSCTTTIAQGNGQQAGTGNLSSFEVEFLATLSAPQAGPFDVSIYADDGWLLALGADSQGHQPAYVAGPLNNAPSNLKAPFSGYPVIGASNVPESPTQFTVTVTFPAAGAYPLELDYTECCAGQLTLVVGDLSSSTVTPTPPPATTPTPGGTWILPNSNPFTITGDTLHVAAHADRTNPWDPPIDHVNFTAYFLGVNPDVWVIACQANSLTPGTTDRYECDWNLSPGVPNGPITISFDVYDAAGNRSLAPNGTLQGTISRPAQHVLLAPFPKGVTMELLNGYNNPLPGANCPAPGENEHDHCMNQQYGFDFISTTPTATVDIIAPAAGTVAWISKDKTQPEYCVGLTLDVGDVNLTICHFASLNGQLMNKHVDQGYLLGTMADHIHLSLDDRYQDSTHNTCSPSITATTSPRTCRPIPFNGYYAIEGQDYDPAFDANGQPLFNQFGCTQGDPGCILITSTNPEINT